MKMLWKVCGMRDEQNIRDVLALGPDFMGFIFYIKSKRYAGTQLSEALLTNWEFPTKKVGVFVNENLTTLFETVKRFNLDYIQLHGDEDVEYCKIVSEAGLRIIKAFAVDETFDFASVFPFENSVDFFLFDTKASGGYGGHGKSFDWSLLNQYKGAVPFFLAGGIDNENILNLKEIVSSGLFALDINSRFEDEPALKNLAKLSNFKNQLELF
jgi:phosphoribosylanthranilate isomerase